MKTYLDLLENNRRWAQTICSVDPEYFAKQAAGQQPNFLFIGCCDSRVPTELLTGARPGEIFTHRNIANQVHPNDLSVLSVLEYGINVLNVKHVVVCGHYNCGGVRAAMDKPGHGVVDNWLQVVRDVRFRHRDELEQFDGEDAKCRRLVELNVLEQVFNLSRTPTVLHAWDRGPRPILHGLVYDVNDGYLKELVSNIDGEAHALELRGVVTSEFASVPATLHAS
jgi:carbonic anhydrase